MGANQQEHWAAVFADNPDMYGAEPSEPAIYAAGCFGSRGARRVLELGAGQGRDTLFLAGQGFEMVALDFVGEPLARLTAKAARAGLSIANVQHDVRDSLPFAAAEFDAVYAHMLFCMALTTEEIHSLVKETRRVLRPGGIFIYTVRHTGDAHYRAGVAHGDDTYENGGFIVHFFTDELVQQLADGFELLDVTSLTEGDLPRRLWCVTMQRLE